MHDMSKRKKKVEEDAPADDEQGRVRFLDCMLWAILVGKLELSKVLIIFHKIIP